MSDVSVPCPACAADVDDGVTICPACGRGIATVTMRARVHGEPRSWTRRIACDPDEVDVIDGTEAELDNPEDLPGRES